MHTTVLRADKDTAIERCLEILTSGGLIAFPTDTVYGLGALAFSEAAVQGIYEAKRRDPEKAVPVLLSDAGDLALVSDDVSQMALRLAKEFWPGPITLIVRKNSRVPKVVSASETVGVRVPDHELARRLLRAAGPMAVTSANASGQQSPSTADEVMSQLGDRIALILDGGRTPGGIPSTVVDCTGPEPIILRAGPIALQDVRRALK